MRRPDINPADLPKGANGWGVTADGRVIAMAPTDLLAVRLETRRNRLALGCCELVDCPDGSGLTECGEPAAELVGDHPVCLVHAAAAAEYAAELRAQQGAQDARVAELAAQYAPAPEAAA